MYGVDMIVLPYKNYTKPIKIILITRMKMVIPYCITQFIYAMKI